MKKFSKPIYVTRPLFPPISKVTKKVEEIWNSQWLSNNGPQHALLEKKLISHLKVPHLSLFNNGTIALLIAIKALDLKGEVITTPFTFPATPHTLTWNGLTPVFCDINPKSMNIDADKIESLITKKTSAILAVHVFGTPCDVKKISKIAKKHNLKVIYDAAHAFGTEIDGKGIGTFGDITMFSFHPTKLFHTGEGGALTCKTKKMKEKIDRLKNFGIKDENTVLLPGINGKMNEIQAGLGLIVLDEIQAERKRREKIEKVYRNVLNKVPGITLPPTQKRVKSSFQYFVIRISEKEYGKSRDYLYKKLKEYNVYTRKYFFPLCSSYPHYSCLPSSNKLPVAQSIVKDVLSLPFYGKMELSDANKIGNLIKKRLI